MRMEITWRRCWIEQVRKYVKLLSSEVLCVPAKTESEFFFSKSFVQIKQLLFNKFLMSPKEWYVFRKKDYFLVVQTNILHKGYAH